MSKTDTTRVIFVEYHDGRPHSVVTRTRHVAHDGKPYHAIEYYDFDWCERDGAMYYHLSGAGGGAKFSLYPCSSPYQVWAAKGVKLVREDTKGRWHPATILDSPLPGWPLDRLFDMAWESETEYCPVCRDDFPSDDAYTLCDHVWWCDESGDWSKPGERCPDDCPDCLDRERETRGDETPLGRQARGFGWAAIRSDHGRINGRWLCWEDRYARVVDGYGLAADRVG